MAPYTNLLGTGANCEDINYWSIANGSKAIITTDKVFGTGCLEATSTGSEYGLVKTLNLDITKYYFLSGYAKNVSDQSTLSISFRKTDYSVLVSSTTSIIKNNWTRLGVKIAPSGFAGQTSNMVLMTVLGNLSSGDKTYFDGMSLVEITQSEYDTLTTAQLLDNYQFLQFYTNWSSDDYYNYSDLNRVEANTNELALLISSYSKAPTLESQITNRDNTVIEYYDSLNRIERNITALKTATSQPSGWITPKITWASLQSFNYDDANRLESNLQSLYIMVNNIKASVLYCGTFACGEGNTQF